MLQNCARLNSVPGLATSLCSWNGEFWWRVLFSGSVADCQPSLPPTILPQLEIIFWHMAGIIEMQRCCGRDFWFPQCVNFTGIMSAGMTEKKKKLLLNSKWDTSFWAPVGKAWDEGMVCKVVGGGGLIHCCRKPKFGSSLCLRKFELLSWSTVLCNLIFYLNLICSSTLFTYVNSSWCSNGNSNVSSSR